MLTAEGCRTRRERLWESLPDAPDWILISEPQYVVYFASYYPDPFSYSTQNASALLLLGADGSSLLIADSLTGGSLQHAQADSIRKATWYNGRHTSPPRQQVLIEATLEALGEREGDRFGIDGAVPAEIVEGLRARRPDLSLTEVTPILHALKRRKEPDELALIRLAIRAADAGYAAARAKVTPGMTELEMYYLVHEAAVETTGFPVLIYGDFVSGPRCLTGGAPTARVIEPNDLVLQDFSVIVHGYRGDLCSTFVAGGGKATPAQKEIERICLEAMAAGEALLRPGTACREIDRAVRGVLERHQLGDRFPHHAGHGLGLGHPDAPYIVPESADTLLEGDVITLEPGAYVPEVGGMRFEHNYLITENGYERLSTHLLGLETP